MITTLYNLNILFFLLLLSHPTISKFYQPTNCTFFMGGRDYYPLLIFGGIGRNYVITIISNITVLVSHNVICFGYFMPMSHGVNKEALPIVSPAPLPYLVFTRFACCFTRTSLLTFFCSDQIIAKNNTFFT